MPDSARVSVIIPARNAGATLAETLDSLLAQTDPDWRAIIVDNRSTDDTAQIIQRYSARDPRFTTVDGPGEGASAARNVGLANADGDRIMFLDSDDWVDPDFLELMNGALDASPEATAAYCGYRRVMPDGGLTPIRSDPFVARDPVQAFARSCAVAIHAVLFRRSVLTGLDGFDPALRTCEDWDLWQRMSRRGGAWVHVDRPLAYYRASPHSLTRNMAQMLADARVAIARGYDAAGADVVAGWSQTREQAYAYFALWCAGCDIAVGGTGEAAFDAFGDLPSDDPDAIANTLFDAIMVGSRLTPGRLASAWPAYGPGLTSLIEAIGRRWADPVAQRALQYVVERMILDYDDLTAPRHLSLTLGVRVDLRDPRPLKIPGGVDRLYVYLCNGPHVLTLLHLGVVGDVTRRQWVELAVGAVGFKPVAKPLGRAIVRRPWAWRHLSALTAAARAVRGRKGGGKAQIARAAVLALMGPPSPPGSHAAQVAEILASAKCRAEQAALAEAPQPESAPRKAEGERGGDRQDFWEEFFDAQDPWNYGSAYEQEKYERQLSLVPEHITGHALELACAEGHFTRRLLKRVDHLIATDISSKALERAKQRCEDAPNVEFRRLDLSTDALPQGLDLILCSEVLYYLDDIEELRGVAERIAAALKPGGRLVMAHAFLVKDNPDRTGFDWENPFGAATISATFAAIPGLALERSIETELYRIDRFMRPDEAVTPVIEELPVDAPIEYEVARFIIRSGVVARRADVVSERRDHMPVLMYHRVADDGPEALARYRTTPEAFRAQMGWLRRNGYHSITSAQLQWFIANNHPFVGRPVLISFDDGFQDVADNAWPILREHDLSAELFIVSDLVGTTSSWDAAHGETSPLMDAAAIARLAAEGCGFGSHLATHRPATGLSSRELAEELARSRAVLDVWTERPTTALAAPFGITDDRLRRLARECGYQLVYSTEERVVALGDDVFNLPRIEVRGDWTLDHFVRRMEGLL